MGGWIPSHMAPPDQHHYGMYQMGHQQMGHMYYDMEGGVPRFTGEHHVSHHALPPTSQEDHPAQLTGKGYRLSGH